MGFHIQIIIYDAGTIAKRCSVPFFFIKYPYSFQYLKLHGSTL